MQFNEIPTKVTARIYAKISTKDNGVKKKKLEIFRKKRK